MVKFDDVHKIIDEADELINNRAFEAALEKYQRAQTLLERLSEDKAGSKAFYSFECEHCIFLCKYHNNQLKHSEIKVTLPNLISNGNGILPQLKDSDYKQETRELINILKNILEKENNMNQFEKDADDFMQAADAMTGLEAIEPLSNAKNKYLQAINELSVSNNDSLPLHFSYLNALEKLANLSPGTAANKIDKFAICEIMQKHSNQFNLISRCKTDEDRDELDTYLNFVIAVNNEKQKAELKAVNVKRPREEKAVNNEKQKAELKAVNVKRHREEKQPMPAGKERPDDFLTSLMNRMDKSNNLFETQQSSSTTTMLKPTVNKPGIPHTPKPGYTPGYTSRLIKQSGGATPSNLTTSSKLPVNQPGLNPPTKPPLSAAQTSSSYVQLHEEVTEEFNTTKPPIFRPMFDKETGRDIYRAYKAPPVGDGDIDYKTLPDADDDGGDFIIVTNDSLRYAAYARFFNNHPKTKQYIQEGKISESDKYSKKEIDSYFPVYKSIPDKQLEAAVKKFKEKYKQQEFYTPDTSAKKP